MRDGAESAAALARTALPMCQTDFLDMCEERSLAGKCGNPLCKGPHMWQAPLEETHIDWSTRAVVKTSAPQHWCSDACHAKCAAFAHRLGSSVDRLDVLRKLGHAPGARAPRLSMLNLPQLFRKYCV